jgi:multidrug resistance efflux pump
MKVRYNPPKARQPAQEGGIEVLYGPARRLQSRLRWYAVLALVLSPVIYFAWQFMMAVFTVEAPARLQFDTHVYRAPVAGIIRNAGYRLWDTLTPEQVMLTIFSPDKALRNLEFEASLSDRVQSTPVLPDEVSGLLANGMTNPLRQRADHAFDEYQTVRRLFSQGAATRAELNFAHDRWVTAQENWRAEAGRLMPWQSGTVGSDGSDNGSTMDQNQYLEQLHDAWQHLNAPILELKSRSQGQVSEVMAREGDYVTPGAPLLSVRRLDNPYIVAWMSPGDSAYAEQGAPVEIRTDRGDRISGELVRVTGTTTEIPAYLRSAFSLESRGLMVIVRPDPAEDVAQILAFEGLPLTVRFPFSFSKSLF